jgi:universal stress protein A
MTAPTPVHIRQIVVATDFSPHSEHAFEAALALAAHFGARLHVLHVAPHEREREAAIARLEALAAERLTAADSTVVVTSGVPASEIVRYADREKADLIVMGTHGRTGLAHVLRGSVAEQVVRHGPCKVLTIRVPERAPEALEARSAPSPPAGPAPARRCLVCAQASEDVVCDPCKALIRAEACYRLSKEEKARR